jgi:phage FluMu gp28-like protein
LLTEIQRTALVSNYEAAQIAEKLSRFSNHIAYFAPQFAPFDFQRDFIDDYASRWCIYRKPRQIGASMIQAHKALGKSLAVPRQFSLFISLMKDDAQEKIAYAKELYDALAETVPVPAIVNASKTELQFSNDARLKAVYIPRGKSRADIYIDEFAHVSQPRKLYRAALPIMSLGGQLAIMSSVLHSGTMFQQIWEQEGGKFQHYKRHTIHWWDCPIHCNNVPLARIEAAQMATPDRIKQFGTEILLEIYDNMLEEDFRMEYEMVPLDDDSALLPWGLILRCSPTGEDAIKAFDDLESVMRYANRDASDPRPVVAGYDVGRRRDTGEFHLGVAENEHHLFERYKRSFDNEPFQVQQDFLEQYLRWPNAKLTIDETGLGMQMAEYLQDKFGEDKVIKMSFTNESKRVMATTLKRYMLQDRIRFQADKDANFQMHSIKRDVTKHGTVTYIVEQPETADSKRHHGDKFWGRAMMVHTHVMDITGGIGEIRFIGDDYGDEDGVYCETPKEIDMEELARGNGGDGDGDDDKQLVASLEQYGETE